MKISPRSNRLHEYQRSLLRLINDKLGTESKDSNLTFWLDHYQRVIQETISTDEYQSSRFKG